MCSQKKTEKSVQGKWIRQETNIHYYTFHDDGIIRFVDSIAAHRVWI